MLVHINVLHFIYYIHNIHFDNIKYNVEAFFICNISDMDECSLNIDGCEEVCQNTVGSYKCSCTQGELSTDGKNCTGMCAAMCTLIYRYGTRPYCF